MNQEPHKQSPALNKARLDKFLLVLNLPKALRKLETKTQRTKDLVNLDALRFNVYGAPVPAISIPHVDLAYAGQIMKVSSHARPTYPALTVNFGVDNQYTNWWVLWKWLDLLNEAKTSYYQPADKSELKPVRSKPIVGTLADYSTDITIFGFTEFDKKTIEFTYRSAFITDLGEITYNYQTPDELRSTFTMQYGQFESTLIDY